LKILMTGLHFKNRIMPILLHKRVKKSLMLIKQLMPALYLFC